MELSEQIKADISQNSIILYMKGTKEIPMCGFSNQVVQTLSHYGVEFKDINILEDQDFFNNIKTFSDWPTIPQLYIKGELVGGCDIA